MCLPIMRGRRRAPGRIGTIDVREVLRDALRNDGEIVTLAFRRRPDRQRRVLVLIDVSGSLKANSPANLRFAHALVHGAERAEVFTFGTRLTRITSILRHAEVDEALAGCHRTSSILTAARVSGSRSKNFSPIPAFSPWHVGR